MKIKEIILEYNLQNLLSLFQEKYKETKQKDPSNIHDTLDQFIKSIEDPLRKENKFQFIDPYMKWIVQRYVTGKLNRYEDIMSKVIPGLLTYDSLKRKNKLKPEHKDINGIKDINELLDVLDQYREEDTKSGKEKEKEIEENFYRNGEAELIYNDSDLKIVVPKTERASCFFGRNTRWCTAATQGKNYFERYNNEGKLFIILIKKENKRFQFHFNNDEYMDENDHSVDLENLIEKYPKLSDVFSKLKLPHGKQILFKNSKTLTKQEFIKLLDFYNISKMLVHKKISEYMKINHRIFDLSLIKKISEMENITSNIIKYLIFRNIILFDEYNLEQKKLAILYFSDSFNFIKFFSDDKKRDLTKKMENILNLVIDDEKFKDELMQKDPDFFVKNIKISLDDFFLIYDKNYYQNMRNFDNLKTIIDNNIHLLKYKKDILEYISKNYKKFSLNDFLYFYEISRQDDVLDNVFYNIMKKISSNMTIVQKSNFYFDEIDFIKEKLKNNDEKLIKFLLDNDYFNVFKYTIIPINEEKLKKIYRNTMSNEITVLNNALFSYILYENNIEKIVSYMTKHVLDYEIDIPFFKKIYDILMYENNSDLGNKLKKILKSKEFEQMLEKIKKENQHLYNNNIISKIKLFKNN